MLKPLTLFLYFSLYFHQPILSDDSICCTHDQWEGLLHLGYGTVFLDSQSPKTAYSYINGTIRVAYDYTNIRSYMKLELTEQSPLIPHPIKTNQVMIQDYKKGIQYQINGKECDKSSIGQNMTRQCVQNNGMSVEMGFMAGGKLNAHNYDFVSEPPAVPARITATVIRDGNICMPIHVTYFIGSAEQGSGTLINADVYDTTLGIKDSSIFIPPPSCNKPKTNKNKYSSWTRFWQLR